MENIMETRNLNLYYGDNHALKNINLNIEKNKITALIGPSGCGKSTYLKTLNRMNDLIENVKIEGEVLLEGQDIYDPRVDVTMLRKRVGMVFQKPNPFPMSIYDNIAYGPRIHGIKSRKQLDEIVENSLKGAALWDEVKDRLKKSAMGLSGGQQQRLCIARALAVSPQVLLMDEPTSALDPISTMKIEDLAVELNSDEEYQAFRELERKETELKAQIKEDQSELKELRKARKWIPVEEQLPENDRYILLSFVNFSLPMVGHYEVNEDGSGAFYLGDCNEEDTCVSQDLFVNAWMPLPGPYRPDLEHEEAEDET